MIEIILAVILLLSVMALFGCAYFLYRNNKVRDLRLWFIDNHYEHYDKLPTYEEMLFSFKPLTKEHWLKQV